MTASISWSGTPTLPGGVGALYDRTGAPTLNATLTEIEPDAEAAIDAAIPSTGRVLSLSNGAGGTVITALIDDPDDALPGVVVDIDVTRPRRRHRADLAAADVGTGGNEPADAVAT